MLLQGITTMDNVDDKIINICYAVDDNYAECLKISLFSLLHNRDKGAFYNILIICTCLSEANRESIMMLKENEHKVDISFVDITPNKNDVEYNTGVYISEATIYRLMLFSKYFSEYDRIVYLDCDTIIEGDISKLYFENLDGRPIAAVEETGFRELSYSKKAVFINGRHPYNVDNYRTDALCMEHPENYFNAGVLLLDLVECRKIISFEEVLELLHCGKFHFNDQDILNIIFDGQIKMLDFGWNYQNNVEMFCNLRPDLYGRMYADVVRDKPMIIHYISSHKPWNEEVALGERYHKYKALFIGE